MKIKIILVIGGLLILGLSLQVVIPTDSLDTVTFESKQQGVCWVGGRQEVTEKEIESLVKNNINWISQTPFAWQRSFSDPEIRMNNNSDRVWWGESDHGISKTTQLAEKFQIKTLLKPHLWIRDSWPGDVKMIDEKSWKTWFDNYQTFILHYAKLAESNKIEIFCIGTELTHASAREADWRKLIHEIRKVYSGKLTYAANFHNEFENIKFWDAVDFIGVQAYFPLSQENNPSIEDLIKNWKTHLLQIEKVQVKFDKPVLFTEIGYKSTNDAAIEPWKWPQDNSAATPSTETQARCYEAFFKTAWKKDWLVGAYFWKWYPHGGSRVSEIDFTPQGKPAEQVLLENFKKKND